MNCKIAFATFVMIFLAELGDKTQLAALAASAGSKSPISVFIGAAAALAFSTLIAVLLGSLLPQFLPQHYLKLAAGVAFVIFGIIFITEGLGRKTLAATQRIEIPASAGSKGILLKSAIRIAEKFEEGIIENYRYLLSMENNTEHAKILESIIKEELQHAEALKKDFGLTNNRRQPSISFPPQITSIENSPAISSVNTETHHVVIQEILTHEKSKQAFYESMGEKVKIPALKQLFLFFAQQEKQHCEKLQLLLNEHTAADKKI